MMKEEKSRSLTERTPDRGERGDRPERPDRGGERAAPAPAEAPAASA
jgi:hypothetical protein